MATRIGYRSKVHGERTTVEMNIRQLKIFGERNTGTNAVALLIEQNIGKIICPSMRDFVKDWPAREALTKEFEEPYRHFIHHALVDDIFSQAPTEYKQKHTAPEYSQSFAKNGIGVVFLIKNPYSWVLSMYNRPYGLLLPKPDNFSRFLRNPWLGLRRDNVPSVLSCLLDLWNRKLAAYCCFAEFAKRDCLPLLFLKFEEFVADQLEALSKIRSVFGFPGDSAVVITASTKDPGLDWNYYREYYCGEAWRAAFSAEDLEFCATAINWDLAARFGYEKIATHSAWLGPPKRRVR
jgi:hypothetical protein